jgi:hypothetical protein
VIDDPRCDRHSATRTGRDELAPGSQPLWFDTVPSRSTGSSAERATQKQQQAERRHEAALQRVAEQRAAEARGAAKIERLRALRLARDEAAARAAAEEDARKPSPAARTRRSTGKGSVD